MRSAFVAVGGVWSVCGVELAPVASLARVAASAACLMATELSGGRDVVRDSIVQRVRVVVGEVDLRRPCEAAHPPWKWLRSRVGHYRGGSPAARC